MRTNVDQDPDFAADLDESGHCHAIEWSSRVGVSGELEELQKTDLAETDDPLSVLTMRWG